MGVAWGIVVTVFAVLAWVGQTVSWASPPTGVRLGLMEAESDVEPVYWADIKGEARWDAFTLWTLVVAGILLTAGSGAWAYFGLVGGGIYVYFGGRGISTRMVMQRSGHRIGSTSSVKVGYTFLAVWLVLGLVTAIAAIPALPLP